MNFDPSKGENSAKIEGEESLDSEDLLAYIRSFLEDPRSDLHVAKPACVFRTVYVAFLCYLMMQRLHIPIGWAHAVLTSTISYLAASTMKWTNHVSTRRVPPLFEVVPFLFLCRRVWCSVSLMGEGCCIKCESS